MQRSQGCFGIPKSQINQIRLNTSNGYGSSGTMIRRFLNVGEMFGDVIIYQDDPVWGGSFTVKESGWYAVSYFDNGNAAMNIGISLNASVSELSTSIVNIGVTPRLALARVDSTQVPAFCSWTGYIAVGGIIRAHTDSTAVGTNPARVGFSISKLPG